MKRYLPFAIALLFSSSVFAEWEVKIESDLMTDQRNAQTIGYSDSVAEDKTGASILVRCNGQELDVMFHFGVYLSPRRDGGKWTTYDLRFDKEPMETFEGEISKNKVWLFAESKSSLTLIEKFSEAETVLFRTIYSPTGDMLGPFKVQLKGAVNAIQEACGEVIQQAYATQEAELAERKRLDIEKAKYKEQERLRLEEERVEEELAAQKNDAQEAEKKATRARRLRIKNQLTKEYQQSMREAVTKQFKPPSDLRPGALCTVTVALVYPNEIVNVQILSCDGGEEMEKAVYDAVWDADPLPLPPHKAVYERNIIFEFKPGG